jgi:hypothetical protein
MTKVEAQHDPHESFREAAERNLRGLPDRLETEHLISTA